MNPLLESDLVFDEVVKPAVRWCKSGHPIPEHMKVYKASGPALPKSCWGEYCEFCMTLASKAAAERKRLEKGKPAEETPEPVNLRLLKIQLRRAGFTGGIVEDEEGPNKELWEEFLETA